MKRPRRKKLPSWIAVYAGLVAAIVLAERDRGPGPGDLSLVSPVADGGSQPALELQAITRRSDL